MGGASTQQAVTKQEVVTAGDGGLQTNGKDSDCGQQISSDRMVGACWW